MNQAPARATFDVVLAMESGDEIPAIQNRIRGFAAPFGYGCLVLFS